MQHAGDHQSPQKCLKYPRSTGSTGPNGTIRLAELLERELHVKVVPLFWLASEDHDFTEINRAYLLKQDGEVGVVSFAWEEQGRPISDL
ncbi:bacillithiol biosynthesis BshC, partial [Candidatus Bipolaricaulota bacterium]|nr:bacillithiol biosynthesis BshC [Candidatus Bipolaricaulota bacterium]